MTKTRDLADLGGGFIQAGTGAVQRTVESKLQDVVSVKDFGAKGDGVTDDALAINRATKYVASLPNGGTVYYPPGIYRITRAIRLDDYDIETFTYSGNPRKNVRHQGAGRDCTTIKSDTFWCSIFTSFPEPFLEANDVLPKRASANDPVPTPNVFLAVGVVIDGLTLDGNYDSVPDGGTLYGSHYNSYAGTWPDGSSGPSTWAADNYQYPIYAYQVKDLQVTNCRVKRSWYNGISVYTCYGGKFLNNIIENCGDKANYLGTYAAFEPDNASNDIVFADNTVRYCGNGIVSNGDSHGYAYRSVGDVIIRGNTFVSCSGNGIYAFDWVTNWLVDSNIFRNINSHAIMFFLQTPPGGPIINGGHPTNITVSNNQIIDYNLTSSAGNPAIRCEGQEFTVTGNHIESNGSSANDVNGIIVNTATGMVITKRGEGNVIANNLITGSFKQSSTNNSLISPGKNTLVTGNTINSTSNLAHVAIRIAADNVIVESNRILGTYQYVRPIYYVSGANCVIADANYAPLAKAKLASAMTGLATGWHTVDFQTGDVVYDNALTFAVSNNAMNVNPGFYRLSATVSVSHSDPNTTGAIQIESTSGTAVTSVSYNHSNSATYAHQVTGTIEVTASSALVLRVYSASPTFNISAGTTFELEPIPSRPR